MKYCSRPFTDVYEMNKILTENYNSVVSPNDFVIWLGDVSMHMKPTHLKEIVDKFNGHKMLVMGNHDTTPKKMLLSGFDIVVREATISIAGFKVKLNHFPYKPYLPFEQPDKYASVRPTNDEWDDFLIHGHTHKKEKFNKREIHVGVDAWNYFPAMYEDVEKFIIDISSQGNVCQ